MNPIHPALSPLAFAAKRFAADRASAPGFLAALRAALGRSRDWLRPEHRIGDPNAYMRHLLYTDAEGDFVMTAITWLPGQKSPLHGHHVWCAFGVAEGTLTEERFEIPADGSTPSAAGVVQLAAGEVAGLDVDGRMAHRVSNTTRAPLVSLHLYGVPGERLTTGINRLFS